MSCATHEAATKGNKVKRDESWKTNNGKYRCPYCSKEYSGKGIMTHIWRKHEDGQNIESWNKGLTAKTDDRVRNNVKHSVAAKQKNRTKKININRARYYMNPKYCTCHKIISFDKRNNEFCNRNCANSRIISEEHKEKTRKTLLKTNSTKMLKNNKSSKLFLKICISCNSESLIRYKAKPSNCRRCANILIASKGGKASAAKQQKRSKAEIELFELLNSFYPCEHNEPIFNGWDADIIIPSLKLAILWNGPWHYKQMFGSHSIKQVKNRDDIKLKEINKIGWNHISVRDWNNKMNPKRAFAEIAECINHKKFNLTIR